MDIEVIIEGIDAKLVGPGSDEDKLTKSENAFLLAYTFDDLLRSEGFTSFIFGRSREEWQKTCDALSEVGAAGYADIFERFVRIDGEAFSQQGNRPPGSEAFEYSEDYDASFTIVRDAAGGEDDAAYIEEVLQAYAQRTGLADQ